MAPSQSKDLHQLLSSHESTISLLKTKVEALFPDLMTTKSLEDGTVVDNLFYLRYILSSKDDLTSKEGIEDSKTLKYISYAIKKRVSDFDTVEQSEEAQVLQSVPLLKTGELENGTPVLFLPVKQVDFDKITSNKAYESSVKAVLLAQRSKLFKELDQKTRTSGKIVKSVTIYDLKGISYSHIFKLKDFFKLVQAQGKEFKKLFPQCTEMTVFVNVSASYLLKSFITSSKQKVMTVKQLISTLDCKQALPDTIGGEFRWPQSDSQLFEAFFGHCAASFDNKVALELNSKPIEYVSSSTVEGKNVKQRIESLERQMVTLRKSRLYSINVLRAKQTVDLLFTNFKNKRANVLIITKQEKITTKRKIKLPKGFSTLPLKLETAGEIVIVYLDSSLAKKYDKRDICVENVKLKRSAPRRLARYGRKKLKSKKSNVLSEQDFIRQQQMGGTLPNKVLFRFEVSESVVCGTDRAVTKEEEVEISKLPEQENEVEVEEASLCEFDAMSLTSKDSLCSNTQPSFLTNAAQILTNGFWW